MRNSKRPETTGESSSALEERRAYVRHPCEGQGSCQPLLAAQKPRQLAKVMNISRGGIAVSINRRFETGTLLTIEIQRPASKSFVSLVARVARISNLDDGNWLLGCSFNEPMTEEDLQAILSDVSR